MHGRIFGGFLMRRAYELAFATVHMFAGQRPRFVEVGQVCASHCLFVCTSVICRLLHIGQTCIDIVSTNVLPTEDQCAIDSAISTAMIDLSSDLRRTPSRL
jgi:hypothetical protein